MSILNRQSGIIRRILGADNFDLQPEIAGFFLALQFTAEDDQRIAELSEKANEGNLNSEERDELGLYVMLGDFIAIMQSKARASLLNHTPAA